MPTENGTSEPISQEPRRSAWEEIVPWFLTIASTLTLVAIALYLVENVLYFRSVAFHNDTSHDLVFRMHAHHLHIAMVKRSIGLFSGFALLFLGTGVLFYQTQTKTRYKVSSQVGTHSLGADIVTASPGIVTITLAVVLLLGTIASKDKFPVYQQTPNQRSHSVGANDIHIPKLPPPLSTGRKQGDTPR